MGLAETRRNDALEKELDSIKVTFSDMIKQVDVLADTCEAYHITAEKANVRAEGYKLMLERARHLTKTSNNLEVDLNNLFNGVAL